jgi:regulator of protease activity HflC (stomatin/prohibitin superfamily)
VATLALGADAGGGQVKLWPALAGAALFLACAFFWAGLQMVNPNQAVVLQLFGAYRGTSRTTGLRWFNPFLRKTMVSVRIKNFDSAHLKVNDKDGNPIEIGAIIVYRVRDTAKATFQVQSCDEYVRIQTETAVRVIASRHPYDGHDDMVTLRGSPDAVSAELLAELQTHVLEAGVEILSAKLSHLAYAPEIAHAMLQRQQASAIVAARQRIVEGAVGMVHDALRLLEKQGMVTLDEDRRAAMVSNLLVVLCGDRSAQPVVNTGTLYQ